MQYSWITFFLVALFCNNSNAVSFFDDYDENLLFQDMDRTHIPIDGETVAMIPYREGDKFGFVRNNKAHELIIAPEYDQVFSVYGDKAIVKKGRGYGVVDGANQIIVPFQYANVFKEHDLFHCVSGIYVDASLPNGYQSFYLNQYFNLEGELVFTQRAQYQGSFTNGERFAWFQMADTIVVVNKRGHELKKITQSIEHSFLGIYNDLLCYATKNGNTYTYTGYSIFNEKKFEVTGVSRGWYAGIIQLSPNFYALISDVNVIHYCDGNGTIKPFKSRLSALEMEKFYPFNSNNLDSLLIRVGHPDKMRVGVVNAKGEMVIPFEYLEIHPFSEGVAVAKEARTGRYVFIGEEGESLGVFPKAFFYGFELQMQTEQLPIGFFDGLCFASDYVTKLDTLADGSIQNKIDLQKSYFYFFDKAGERKFQLERSLRFVGNFNEGLAPAVNRDRKLGFINQEGAWVIQPIYELTMAGSYPMPYLVIPAFKGGYVYIKSFKGYVDRYGNEYFGGERVQDEYNFSH